MPAVEQVLAQLAEASVFSKLDANSGFWQIPFVTQVSTTYNVHYTIWPILLPQTSLWHYVSSRTFSATNVRDS